MNLELRVVEPGLALVEWASKIENSTGLKLPFDRPWYQLNASPTRPVDTFKIACKCLKEHINLKKHSCEDESSVYMGQCPRCEIIVWTYGK
jgi:hypothetical protein